MKDKQFDLFSWKNSAGQYIQSYKLCPAKPDFVILNVHGLGEHTGRYLPWAHLFVQKNMAWYGFDHIGHGLSSGNNGHFQSLELLFEGISEMITRIRMEHPKTPRILYGHSMGGNIALNYLLRYKANFKGAIITSPWIRLVDEPSGMLIKLSKFVSQIAPRLSLDSKLNPDYMSSDVDVCENYRNDIQNHRFISARSFQLLYQGGLSLEQNSLRFPIPVFLAHSRKDQLTRFEASESLALKNQGQIQFFPFEKGKHELHNDHTRMELFEQIIDWITSERLKEKKTKK